MNVDKWLALYRMSMLLLLSLAVLPAHAIKLAAPRAAPEFTHAESGEWINSEPLSIESLQGTVLLVDFWTFDCWNCYRSFPWLRSLEERFAGRAFKVIGVHSPEFDHERRRDNVLRKVKEFELDHPIMIDNDFSYWKAIGNRYWPAFYVIDKQGLIRRTFVGETHSGDNRAMTIERVIGQLLDE